jgi:inorganic pyrophosphatase
LAGPDTGREGRRRKEIEHFFQVYKNLEGHKVSTDGFEGRASASTVIEESRARAERSRKAPA